MTNRQSAGILLYRRSTAEALAKPYAASPDSTAEALAKPYAASPDSPPKPCAASPDSHNLEVFLVHPGGPFWKNRDAGSWTIPKGEFDDSEPALDAAIREFHEETGAALTGDFHPLGSIRQKGGKRVFAWAIAGNFDPANLVSNTFEIEWPRGSGKLRSFPEVDKGAWYGLRIAREMIIAAQASFLDELIALLKNDP
jgi:predicted NUDIX family NTP pyrophosphohydrolase